jgi:hypothetical protein
VVFYFTFCHEGRNHIIGCDVYSSEGDVLNTGYIDKALDIKFQKGEKVAMIIGFIHGANHFVD